MATNNVKYRCGCGFETAKVEEAEEHSNSLNHTLTASGEIKKERR